MTQQILVVEDDPSIAKLIGFGLEPQFLITKARDIGEALELITAKKFDLILLDWMLPGLSGIELIRKMRRLKSIKDTPIIMVTAKAEEQNKLQGFKEGVDDYVTKPFSLEELRSRITAVLRRTNHNKITTNDSDFQILSGEKKILYNGNNLNLTKKEFEILCCLLKARNHVCSRAEIIEACWQKDVFDRVVDVNIRRIRKKISIYSSEDLIINSRGFGYRISETKLSNDEK